MDSICNMSNEIIEMTYSTTLSCVIILSCFVVLIPTSKLMMIHVTTQQHHRKLPAFDWTYKMDFWMIGFTVYDWVWCCPNTKTGPRFLEGHFPCNLLIFVQVFWMIWTCEQLVFQCSKYYHILRFSISDILTWLSTPEEVKIYTTAV